MEGWFSEIVIYPFALDSTQRAAVYSYMSTGS
jgi:hypothetical protein